MNDLQILINGQELELDPTTGPVALSFQINSLSEVKNQQGNTSNQFKFPWTARNKRIWNFAGDPTSLSPDAYRSWPAKVVQNGVEIIPVGKAELSGGDSRFGQMVIISGNADFFDFLDIKLADLNFSNYDHTYDFNAVVNNMGNTAGMYYPIINFGTLTNAPSQALDFTQLRPALFVSTIVQVILDYTGYKAVGKLFTDPLYLAMIVPSTGTAIVQPQASTLLIKNIYVKATVITEVLGPNNRKVIIPLNDMSAVPDPYFASNCFIAPVSGSYKFNLSFTAYYQNTFAATGTTIQITYALTDQNNFYAQAASPDLWSLPLTFAAGASQNSLPQVILTQAVLNLKAGQQVCFTVASNQPAAHGYSHLKAGATIEFKGSSVQGALQVGDHVSMAAQLPDMTARTFLKDIFQKFGVICQSDQVNKIITFGYFSDIAANIPQAMDWSRKVIDQDIAVDTHLGSYGQTNYFEYNQDDNVRPAYCRGFIGIDDQTLDPIVTLVTSFFAASNMSIIFNGVQAALIEKVDPFSVAKEFNGQVTPRILIDKKVHMTPLGSTFQLDQTPVVNGVAGTSVLVATWPDPHNNFSDALSIPTFSEAGNPLNLDFAVLVNNYYPALAKVLTRSKKLGVYMLLTELDIARLNFFIPVYLQQYGAYFYINLIENYIKSAPTKVELIKIY